MTIMTWKQLVQRLSRAEAERDQMAAVLTGQRSRLDRAIADEMARRLQHAPIDLGEAIAAAVEACAPQLRERRHALRVDLGPHLGVLGDVERLTQAFVELLDNAIRYTPRRGHIVVLARREAPYVIVEILDDGDGLTPSRQLEIHQHPGRGLTVARDVVALHGGTLSVRSAGHECGSTFLVRLPSLVTPIAGAH